jgi:hypothetical protein
MNKVSWLAIILAMGVLAGCSSRSTPTISLDRPDGHMTGSMRDWVKAVCEGGATKPGPSGADLRYLGGATSPKECVAAVHPENGGRTGPVPILIGTYKSKPLMESDLGGLGAYANGTNGTQYVVFALLPSAFAAPDAASVMLHPLQAYGFEIVLAPTSSVELSPNSPVESLHPTAPPAITPAVPPQTPTSTATSGPSTTTTEPSTTTTTTTTTTTAAAQPHWDGPWLRNYEEDEQDCNHGGLNYWVVQPGGEAGMYVLKKGCFPKDRVDQLNTHCQSSRLPAGKCAIWDEDGIMSVNNKRGDLLVVRLAQTCLDRAKLGDFHEGPLHKECMVAPKT